MAEGSFEPKKPTRKESARMRGADLFAEAYEQEGNKLGISPQVPGMIGLKKSEPAKKESRGTKLRLESSQKADDELTDDDIILLEGTKHNDSSYAVAGGQKDDVSGLDFFDDTPTQPDFKRPPKLADTLSAPRRPAGEHARASSKKVAENFKNYASKPRDLKGEYAIQSERQNPAIDFSEWVEETDNSQARERARLKNLSAQEKLMTLPARKPVEPTRFARAPKLEIAPPDAFGQPIPLQHLEGRISAIEDQLTHLGSGQEKLKQDLTRSLTEEIGKLSRAVQSQNENRTNSQVPRTMPTAFIPPPMNDSRLSSKIKNATEAIRGFWNKLTGKKSAETVKQQENPVSREFLNTLEEAEVLARDLPTMLLSGKDMNGKPLPEKKGPEVYLRRFETLSQRINDPKLAPDHAPTAVESRLRYVQDDRGSSIRELVNTRSSSNSFDHWEVDPSIEEARQHLAKNLPKQLTALDRKMKLKAATGKDMKNWEVMRKLLGASTIDQINTRAVLTCEAAANLITLDMNEDAKYRLTRSYNTQLEAIHKVLPEGNELTKSLKILLDLPVDSTGFPLREAA